MTRNKQAALNPQPSEAEVSMQALAWAEFLYDEFMLEKHKQLLLAGQQHKIERDKER